MSYGRVAGQQSMALDEVRNRAYLAALERVITPESVVLDLGAGLGTLGLLAAKLGARKVYLVEPESVVSLASDLAEANGVADRIEVLEGRIEDVRLPERVDVITSVMTGNFLLDEDLLPTLFHARDKYLKPSGVLIPSVGVMEAAPVVLPAYYDKKIGVWQQEHLGLDVSRGFGAAANSVYWGRSAFTEAELLAPAADLWTLDLATATSTDCSASLETNATRAGVLHGWLGWFRMQLGDAWLSTSPFEPAVHWSAAFLPLTEPEAVAVDDPLGLTLRRPPSGDWTWTCHVAGREQRQSTFFANLETPTSLSVLAADARPRLSPRGDAVARVLAALDGGTSVAQAARLLQELAPADFASPEAALELVRRLVRTYGVRT